MAVGQRSGRCSRFAGPLFQPPEARKVCGTRSTRFILARLENKGIQPSPEADKRTLIRRLSLDVIGLPPSPDEVDEFPGRRGPEMRTGVLVEDRLRSRRTSEKNGPGTGSTRHTMPTATVTIATCLGRMLGAGGTG